MTFRQLDAYLETRFPTKERIIKPCCDNKQLRFNEIHKVCINCGRMYLDDDEIIIKQQFLNPRYQLTTAIGYSNKNLKSIYRLHKWLNYDYRENMANKNYIEIREIGNKLNLNHKILNNACYIYKTIYIDQNISSRNKIKRSLYIYCLFRSCLDYHKDYDIIQSLKDNNLSIENYNKSLLKVKDENKLFLNPNMTIQFKKLKDNWTTDITLKDIILKYNDISKISKNQKNKLNNNSILI